MNKIENRPHVESEIVYVLTSVNVRALVKCKSTLRMSVNMYQSHSKRLLL